MSPIRRALRQRAVRYGVVGVGGTLVDLAVLTALVELAGLPVLVANAFSFSAAVAHNYVLNRIWTFGDREHFPGVITAPAFVIGALVGLGISEAGLFALVHAAGLHYLPAKLVMVGAVFAWNYMFNSTITFRARPSRDATDARS
jgi:dolichol-phosphate mannosyltransferase